MRAAHRAGRKIAFVGGPAIVHTGAGPHLDDVEILAGARDLRAFGSQGEQRLAVLALLLAEAELVRERRGVPPLLLLDDVLSELDPNRRAFGPEAVEVLDWRRRIVHPRQNVRRIFKCPCPNTSMVKCPG